MSEINFQQLCFNEGLTCQACTTTSAQQVARACVGLRAKMVAQLFVQMYPEPACARMLPAFVAAYKAASPVTVTVADALPPRKGVQPEVEPLRAAAAAA
jgi:hypothetical protein